MVIQETYNKPYFFCKNKMDATMEEEADNLGEDFDVVATEKKVRDDCRTELDDRAKEVYLLAKLEEMEIRDKKVLFPDNKKLKEDIIKSIHNLQKTALCKYAHITYCVDHKGKIELFSVCCEPCIQEADRDEGRGTWRPHQMGGG